MVDTVHVRGVFMPRKKKTIGKYDKKSPRIGFAEWNLDTITEGAPELFNKAFKEALDIATEEYEVKANFSYGEKPQDVGVIEIELPIGAVEYKNPTWKFKLSELVENFTWENDPVDIPRLADLRDHMRKLADFLDVAINNLGKSVA